nr:TonB-dependent receptor [Candidatus Krumholzibacteria bacterium]
GYVEGSTGEEFLQDAMTGGTDWLGIDDGGRDLPDFDDRLAEENRNEVARSLPNRWTYSTRKAPPKLSFSLSHGNKKEVLGGDLAYLGAFSYRNKFDVAQTNSKREPDENGAGQSLFSEGLSSNYEVLWGGLGNVYYRFDENHRLGLTNTYTRSADSKSRSAAGSDPDSDFKWQQTTWEERYQYVTKLDGKHDLDLLANGLNAEWGVYYGETSAKEPDARYVEYIVDTVNEEVRERMNSNLRSWTWLDEIRRGWNLDLKYSFADHPEDEPHALKLKAGVGHEERTRQFDMEAWYSSPTFMTSSRALALLPPDEIFSPENYNEEYDERRGALFNFVPETRFSGVYNGDHQLDATYLMADLPFTLFQEDLRLVGGVRVEDSEQFVQAFPDAATDQADTAMVNEKDYLPSLNLTWSYDEDFNIRMAYFKSVNRPEFRELAPVLRRNYTNYQNERGNPNLKRAEIDNFDLRAEYFPGYGEVLAASFFYKDMTNAIEDSLTATPEGALLTWTNAPTGKNYGIELEARKKLDFTTLTEDFTLTVNYTRIWSEVEVLENLTKEVQLRPLQGQAPWLINLNLMYDNPNWGTTVNLLFNKIGRRLDKVGPFGETTDVYLEPYDRLDFVVTRNFWTRYKAKFAAKNILGAEEIRTSGGDSRYEYSRVSNDPEYSVSLSAKF